MDAITTFTVISTKSSSFTSIVSNKVFLSCQKPFILKKTTPLKFSSSKIRCTSPSNEEANGYKRMWENSKKDLLGLKIDTVDKKVVDLKSDMVAMESRIGKQINELKSDMVAREDRIGKQAVAMEERIGKQVQDLRQSIEGANLIWVGKHTIFSFSFVAAVVVGHLLHILVAYAQKLLT